MKRQETYIRPRITVVTITTAQLLSASLMATDLEGLAMGGSDEGMEDVVVGSQQNNRSLWDNE